MDCFKGDQNIARSLQNPSHVIAINHGNYYIYIIAKPSSSIVSYTYMIAPINMAPKQLGANRQVWSMSVDECNTEREVQRNAPKLMVVW